MKVVGIIAMYGILCVMAGAYAGKDITYKRGYNDGAWHTWEDMTDKIMNRGNRTWDSCMDGLIDYHVKHLPKRKK